MAEMASGRAGPGVLASDVERFALADGRRLEGRGELSFSSGRLFMQESDHGGDGGLPFSVALGGAGGFACSWVQGSRELLISVVGHPPCFALVVHDRDVAMDALAAKLGAQIVTSAVSPGGEAPAVVLLAASAIEGTGKVAASVLTGGASIIGAGMGYALQSFRTHVGTCAEPVKLSDTTHSIIDGSHSVASAAEELTGGVRHGLRSVAESVGHSAADTITRSAPLAGSSAGALGKSAVVLGGASASALGEVYGAIEASTETVLGAASSAASGAVGHRYGSDAETATKQLGGSVQKASKAAFNVASFGLRSMARATAKQTVKGVGSNLQAARGAGGAAAGDAAEVPSTAAVSE